MARSKKIYVIHRIDSGGIFGRGNRPDSVYASRGTIDELIETHKYTLECGQSWEHEPGNSKINTHPKTVKTLVNMLNKAINNAAANGYSGKRYELVEVTA